MDPLVPTAPLEGDAPLTPAALVGVPDEGAAPEAGGIVDGCINTKCAGGAELAAALEPLADPLPTAVLGCTQPVTVIAALDAAGLAGCWVCDCRACAATVIESAKPNPIHTWLMAASNTPSQCNGGAASAVGLLVGNRESGVGSRWNYFLNGRV